MSAVRQRDTHIISQTHRQTDRQTTASEMELNDEFCM